MTLHDTTFGFLTPTEDQKDRMVIVRSAAADYAKTLERELPDGPDKTYILRTLRTLAMWANVAVMRHADGTPRREPRDLGTVAVVLDEYPEAHPAPGDLGSVPL